MGVEVFTNKDDTEGVLVCNTTGVPVPGFGFADSDSYDETRREDETLTATDIGKGFIKFMYDTYKDSDPRGMPLHQLKDRFNIYISLVRTLNKYD